MRKSKQAPVILALLALIGLGAYLGSRHGRQTARPVTAGRGSALQQMPAGVSALESDLATAGVRPAAGGWILGGVDVAGAVIAAAEEPKELWILAAEDARWFPMKTWQMSRGGAGPFAVARESCAVEHLARFTEPCEARLSVVVQDDKVVFAKPTPGERQSECEAFASCLARRAWLGRAAPMPKGTSEAHGFVAGESRTPSTETVEEWHASYTNDAQVAERAMATLEKLLDQAPPEDRAWIEHELALKRDIRDHSLWLLEQP